MSGFHSYKPEYVRQEIWAKLTAYNITETLVSHVVVETRDTKHDYQVNFSAAAHICRVFLRQSAGRIRINVMALLGENWFPYGKGARNHGRKQRISAGRAISPTAHPEAAPSCVS